MDTHTHTQLRDTVIDDVSTRDRLDLECVVREHKEYGWDSGMTIGQDIDRDHSKSSCINVMLRSTSNIKID